MKGQFHCPPKGGSEQGDERTGWASITTRGGAQIEALLSLTALPRAATTNVPADHDTLLEDERGDEHLGRTERGTPGFRLG